MRLTLPKLDGKYESELDPDVDMHMEDDVNTPDSVEIDCDVDLGRDSEDDEEEDEQEDDEKEEEEEDVNEEEKKDKEDDKVEDDGEQPWTIGHGRMEYTSDDDVDTTVGQLPILLPLQGQVIPEHTQLPQPLAAATWRRCLDPTSRPRSPEIHLLTGLGHSIL
jgi:hypothetical protein